jgi:heme exporter protein D
MELLSTFLDMGGYGGFVWAAYGIAAFILVGLAAQSVVTLKRTEMMLKQVRAVRREASDE